MTVRRTTRYVPGLLHRGDHAFAPARRLELGHAEPGGFVGSTVAGHDVRCSGVARARSASERVNRCDPRWQRPVVNPFEAEDTDAAVIARSHRAPEQFAEVFDRHQRAVHAYAARRAGQDAADDVLSEVFLAAFGQRKRFDPDATSALPWLYGIAGNILRRRWRSLAIAGGYCTRRHSTPSSTLTHTRTRSSTGSTRPRSGSRCAPSSINSARGTVKRSCSLPGRS